MEAIQAAHARERSALDQSFPAVSRILDSAEHDPERWRADFAGALPVTLGRGPLGSALTVNGDMPARGAAADTLRHLRLAGQRLDDAPITADARLGIGVCGPRALAAAVARAIAVQLANTLSPADTEVSYGPDQDWISGLPHRTRRGPPDSPVVFDRVGGAAPGRAVIAVSESAATLSRECRVVIGVRRPAAVLRHPVPGNLTELRPEPVSEAQARAYAAILRGAAHGIARRQSPPGPREPGRLAVRARPPAVAPMHRRPGDRRRVCTRPRWRRTPRDHRRHHGQWEKRVARHLGAGDGGGVRPAAGQLPARGFQGRLVILLARAPAALRRTRHRSR